MSFIFHHITRLFHAFEHRECVYCMTVCGAIVKTHQWVDVTRCLFLFFINITFHTLDLILTIHKNNFMTLNRCFKENFCIRKKTLTALSSFRLILSVISRYNIHYESPLAHLEKNKKILYRFRLKQIYEIDCQADRKKDGMLMAV